jgi:hypothetical protein
MVRFRFAAGLLMATALVAGAAVPAASADPVPVGVSFDRVPGTLTIPANGCARVQFTLVVSGSSLYHVSASLDRAATASVSARQANSASVQPGVPFAMTAQLCDIQKAGPRTLSVVVTDVIDPAHPESTARSHVTLRQATQGFTGWHWSPERHKLTALVERNYANAPVRVMMQKRGAKKYVQIASSRFDKRGNLVLRLTGTRTPPRGAKVYLRIGATFTSFAGHSATKRITSREF